MGKMKNGDYTKGSLCKCRHTYYKHFNDMCVINECKCRKFRYIKDWRKALGVNDEN